MRHAVKGRKLKRTASHKKALLTNLATALFRHKKIKTTVAKAKEARTFVEKLITKARRGDIPARRYVARFIKDREVIKELFNEIIVKIGERPGGYTRVVKLGSRRGDGADLAILELVDYNEGVAKEPKKKAERAAAAEEEKTKEQTKQESMTAKPEEEEPQEDKEGIKESVQSDEFKSEKVSTEEQEPEKKQDEK